MSKVVHTRVDGAAARAAGNDGCGRVRLASHAVGTTAAVLRTMYLCKVIALLAPPRGAGDFSSQYATIRSMGTRGSPCVCRFWRFSCTFLPGHGTDGFAGSILQSCRYSGVRGILLPR